MDKLKPCEVGQVKFDAQGNREGTIIGSGHWPELVKGSGLTGRWLRLEMTPIAGLDGADWSLLESTQDSLREHMAELHRKDAQLTAANARIAELKKALEPFAREAGARGEHEDETEIVKTCNQTSFFPIDSTFTVGDLRRAAALLEKK